jgi:hypothetical protein
MLRVYNSTRHPLPPSARTNTTVSSLSEKQTVKPRRRTHGRILHAVMNGCCLAVKSNKLILHFAVQTSERPPARCVSPVVDCGRDSGTSTVYRDFAVVNESPRRNTAPTSRRTRGDSCCGGGGCRIVRDGRPRKILRDDDAESH